MLPPIQDRYPRVRSSYWLQPSTEPEDGHESTRWEFDFADASFRRRRMLFNVESASTERSATIVGAQPDESRFYFSDNPASNKHSNTVCQSVNAIRQHTCGGSPESSNYFRLRPRFAHGVRVGAPSSHTPQIART